MVVRKGIVDDVSLSNFIIYHDNIWFKNSKLLLNIYIYIYMYIYIYIYIYGNSISVV